MVTWILRNILQWYFNRNSNIFIQENVLQNVVCEMVSILSRPQCVKNLLKQDGGKQGNNQGTNGSSIRVEAGSDKIKRDLKSSIMSSHTTLGINLIRLYLRINGNCLTSQTQWNYGNWEPWRPKVTKAWQVALWVLPLNVRSIRLVVSANAKERLFKSKTKKGREFNGVCPG